MDILNTSKTYIGLEYGTGLIGKKIAQYTKEYAPDLKEVPSHVLALVYRGDLEPAGWWVYESHLKGYNDYSIPSGCRHYPLEVWEAIEAQNIDDFRFYELDFNTWSLERDLGQPYGIREITALLRANLFNREGKQSDKKGIICSEYLARAHKGICKHFNLKEWCITPAHWAQYLYDKEIE
jgi:hypothetical protein